MESGQYLKFLRPYLFQVPPLRTAVYARFFSASHRSESPDAPRKWKRKEEEASPSRQINVDNRVQKLKDCRALHYPRLGDRPFQISIPRFLQKFHYELVSSEVVTLEGRIMSVRRSSNKLVFFTIMGGNQQVQIMVSYSKIPTPKMTPMEFAAIMRPFLRGDIISIMGTPTRTDAGELTLQAIEPPILLTPGLAPLPTELVNQETMVLNRHIDLLVNRRTSDTIRLRSHVIRSMRAFFHKKEFLEVQTPILADHASGAAARPFLTSATEFPAKELALRIAPELWLKRLVIGGNDRVFEIGPSFRNESVDTTHNPEFTMCEFYCAYFNLDDLISITVDLITHLFKYTEDLIQNQLQSLKKPKITLPKTNWKRVEFIPELERILCIEFPDLSEPDALPKLIELLDGGANINQGPDLTLAKLLDGLASEFLEPLSNEEPLFIIHHPACMAPLSKSFTCPETGQLVSARAELFIKGHEIANMYEEENDPFEQRRKFELQLESRKGKPVVDDGSTPEVDESYIQALEIGLPPTGGWGCGVDRLIMLLSGAARIGDVLSFGNLRNVTSIRQAAKDP
ncbi:lysyl-tRNA synthetase [Hypoxylon sp. FL1857]|nr:lysyl-tRNA synthetase [Hypoxylon sp. FL1857]